MNKGGREERLQSVTSHHFPQRKGKAEGGFIRFLAKRGTKDWGGAWDIKEGREMSFERNKGTLKMLGYWPGSSAKAWTGCKSAQGAGWESSCAKTVHLHGWNMQSHYSKNTLVYDLLFSRTTWHDDRISCENKQASHSQKTHDVFYHHQRCYNNGKMLLLRPPAVKLVLQMTPAHGIYTTFWVNHFLPLSHSRLLLNLL